MESAETILQSTFGFDRFLGRQKEVIDCILTGRSALAVFPTGGGKSLCYQLPAVMQDGLTLVVSPLIALMKDQIDFLQSKGIAAARQDSSLSPEEARQVRDDTRSGRLKLLYVSPERLSNERFVQSMQSVAISLMVVDEAHCISEWGHNFRPDYLKLVRAAWRLKIAKILALTATATPRVAHDIRAAFQIRQEDYIHDSFHRPNLEMHLTPVSGVARDNLLLERLQGRPRGATIVYVTLQKTAEAVAALLKREGLPAKAYHAGMDGEVRHAVQDWFMCSSDGIVVATIAFGMGIDKSNIRYVYHYNLPKSIENYAQETGRAGRDGAPALCELLACSDDRTVLENFIYGDTPIDSAVRGVVETVLAKEGEFFLSHYTLAREFDLRPLVLSTLMTWLELKGLLEAIGAYPGAYRFQPRRSSAEILAEFDEGRAAFLKQVFQQARKGRTWFSLELLATAEAIGEKPERIVRAINFLEEKGDLEVQMSQMMQRYRMEAHPEDPEGLIAECVQRFQQREDADIDRLQQVLELAEHRGCRVAALLRYFGEDLPGDRCGHCDVCLGQSTRPLPAPTPPSLSPEEAAALQRLAEEHLPALGHPRQLARYLCGITSPGATRAKLTRRNEFGMLVHIPFAVVLHQAQAALCGRDGGDP